MTGAESILSGLRLVFLGLVATAGAGASGADTAQPANSAQPPELPQIDLTPFDESTDDEAFLGEKARQVAALVQQAGASEEPLGRTDRLLAAANLILSYQVEPACSRAFLRLPLTEPSPHVPPPGEALNEARSLLDQAGAALELIENPTDEQTTEIAKRTLRLDVLRAFAQAQRAYVAESVEALEGVDPRSAASELSPILEHPKPPIAAAAKFWQTCLRAREEDVRPALARLEPALLPPLRATQPYSFFARLLRCRLLAEEGHPATALLLLLQIEERCHQAWFHRAELKPVLRTVALFRLQILRDWYERLSAETEGTEREWCVSQMEQVIESRFGGEARDVLRIAPAVPIVAAAPPAEDAGGSAEADEAPDGEAPPDTE